MIIVGHYHTIIFVSEMRNWVHKYIFILKMEHSLNYMFLMCTQGYLF
jgi:hypothetical protein